MSQPQPNRVGPPKFLKWSFVGLSFLAGPVLLVASGAELFRRSQALTETATATVVDVRTRDAHETKLFCAIYQWQHGERTVEAVAAECEQAVQRPTQGDVVTIRYSPDDVETPYKDEWWDIYGMAVPTGIAGILFTALFAFLVLPRKST